MVVVPAIVKFAFIFVGLFLGNMKWPVRGATGPIHEERFVWREGLVLPQPGDGVVGEIFAYVIIVMPAGSMRMLNIVGVPNELWLPLRCFAADKPVEVFESITSRPMIWYGPAAVDSSAGVLCHLPQAAVR